MVRLTPIKGNLLTLLLRGVSSRQWLFRGGGKGGRKFPEYVLKAAAFVGEERMAGQDNTLHKEITKRFFCAVGL